MLVFSIVATVVFLVDLISKQLVLQHIPYGAQVILWPAVLNLTHVRNTGAAFGMLAGQKALFFSAAVVVTVALVYFRRDILAAGPWAVVASALILGGTLGNLLDRIRFDGQVIDFISFSFFPPVFNLADSALVMGALIMAVVMFRLEAA